MLLKCRRRGWRSIFFPCKPRNKDRKLRKCCYCISWHWYICIRTLSFEVLWSGRVMVCFRLRKFQNILPHPWSRQWFRFGLSWSSTGSQCPHWMRYSQQSRYKKQSCQGRSWELPLFKRIWQGCIEWWNDCWCWEVSPKMCKKAWYWHFRWTAFYCLPWEILEFDTERFPPTSDNIRQYIMRAYLQCYIWLHSAFLENLDLNPLEYDYRLTEDSNLVPIKSTKPSIPSNFS